MLQNILACILTRFCYYAVAIAGMLTFQTSFAQPVPLSLREVYNRIASNLPQLEAYRQQSAAARQAIQLARNTFVPDLEIGYQANVATFNNITGMTYPGILLPISGPPSQNNKVNLVPGSGLGGLLTWNPFTFGNRQAAIEKATAQFHQANAIYNEQLFRFQYTALNTYLETVYHKLLFKSLQAAISRHHANLDQSLVLTKAGLRPGIDTAQFQTALNQSEIDLLVTERTYNLQLGELARLTGLRISSGDIILTDTVLLPRMDMELDSVSSVSSHPVYQTLAAGEQIIAADLEQVRTSWVPQLDIWGNAYARGSGIDASGVINKIDGFHLSRTNLGLGVQLSFPVLQFSAVNIRKKQYHYLLKAEKAKLEQAQMNISNEIETALRQVRQDILIARKSPMLLKSATDVYEGLTLSYKTGLVDVTRVSEAQYNLLKAEVNNTTSILQVYRSYLALAVAKGNLDLFMAQFK